MKNSRIYGAGLLGLALLAFSFWHSFAIASPDKPPDFPKADIVIERADGKIFPYRVEVATTEEQDMYGLMFRRDVPVGTGMIFLYDPPRDISMWMKNTYVGLDMLFVRKDSVISKIIEGAKPLDLTPLPSDGPVHGVIELKAGDVARNGFKTGDKVRFFSQH